nr:retrovirus-related Pol polyprotein from transposon TNT 1-94 [Tanacetum cinerariifolium]
MYPCIETSLNHEEDNLEIDEPQSDIVPIHRSTRTRHTPDHMCLYIDVEEHELGDLGKPANYKAALLDSESEKWLNAMNVEIQSMKDNEVWVLVELPPDGKTIGSKWLFKKKTNMDGVVPIKLVLWQRDILKPQGLIMRKPFLQVSYYTDVGYLTNADDLKSQTGNVFVLNGGAVDWKSAKQIIFATSSAKAEYIAAFDASKEVVWVRKFIFGLRVVPIIEEPISMYCDNTGAIDIANESGITKEAKYIAAFDASKEAVWVRKFISGLVLFPQLKNA